MIEYQKLFGEEVKEDDNLKKEVKVISNGTELEKQIENNLMFKNEENKKEEIYDDKENNLSHISLDPPKEITLITFKKDNSNSSEQSKKNSLVDNHNNINNVLIENKKLDVVQESQKEETEKNNINDFNKVVEEVKNCNSLKKEENEIINNNNLNELNEEFPQNKIINIEKDIEMTLSENLISSKPIKIIKAEDNINNINNNITKSDNKSKILKEINEDKVPSKIQSKPIPIFKNKELKNSIKENNTKQKTETLQNIAFNNQIFNNNTKNIFNNENNNLNDDKCNIIDNKGNITSKQNNKENTGLHLKKVKSKLNHKVKSKRGLSSEPKYNINSKLNEKINIQNNKVNNIKAKNVLNEVTNNIPKIQRSKSAKGHNFQVNYKNNINTNIGGKVPSFYLTYVPRLYNDKILKKWEEANHKQWYKLSPKTRKIAN